MTARKTRAELLEMLEKCRAERSDLAAKLAACQNAHEDPPPPPSPFPTPPASPLKVTDGQGKAEYGRYFADTDGGLVLRREKFIRNYRDNVRCMAWDSAKGAQPVLQPITVEDLILEDASAVPPQALGGTAESNLWAGMTGEYRRIVGRRGAWMGLWTGGQSADPKGGCTGSVFEDGEWTDTYVGIYVELVTRQTEFRRQKIKSYGPAVRIEWAHKTGPANTLLTSYDLLFEDCEFDCTGKQDTGYWRDVLDFDIGPGNYGITIRDCTFITGGRKPRIGFPKRLVDPSRPNVLENCKDESGNLLVPEYWDDPIG